MKWMICVVLSLSCVALSLARVTQDYDCQTEEVTGRLLRQLSGQFDEVTNNYYDIANDVPMEVEVMWMFEELSRSQRQNLSANASSDCRGCVLFIGALQELIAEGVTFEEVKPLAVNICYPVVLAEGWRPSIVCEDAIDNYGPHLYYVLATTSLDAQGICWKWNSCTSEEVPPPIGNTEFHVPKQESSDWHAPKRQYDKAVPPEDAIKVVHFTDIHVDSGYFTGAAPECFLPVCCHQEWPGNGSAGQWGNYECNIPPRTVELYLQFFYNMTPDYIMYTGDNPPHLTWMETQQGQLNATIYIAEAIGRNLPGVPAFPTMGNHETYPTNLYYTPRPDIQELNGVYYDVWGPLAGFGPDQQATIMDGGYFSQEIRRGLVVLSYNSNYGTTENWYNLLSESDGDYARMRQLMEDTLATARATQQKVILLGHHPSGGGGRFKSYNFFINDILGRYGDVIILHLQGHGHSDSWQITSNATTGEAYNVQISSPSVTSKTDINPSGRVFYLHPDTFEPLDMDTFYLDLQNSMNAGDDPQIQLTYRASVAYGMTDLLPDSFMNLTYRMDEDPDLFAKYRAYQDTNTGFESPCDDACRHSTLCNMRTTNELAAQQC